MTRLAKALILIVGLVVVTGVVLVRVFGAAEAPRQPIEFDHSQHVSKEGGPQLTCQDCHEHAAESAHATIPNVSQTCMACHQVEKADSPEVQKLTRIAESGEQPPWRGIYGFEKEANVFFTHKPHVRAGIDCSACHGQVGQMHRVRREVNQTMGWCIDCHRQRQVSVDCYICHR
jgi:cytochrome c7-like protein